MFDSTLLMQDIDRKKKGAFYTSSDIATHLVNKVLHGASQKILEPSFGDGSFVNAITSYYSKHKSSRKLKDNLFCVEIQENVVAQCRANPLFDKSKVILSDFVAVDPFPVDLVIGNPPYVSLNKLPKDACQRAQHLIELYGFNMQSSGSLWFPFVLHSCAFLNRGGSLAFVLPFEFTYVKYAKQLWRFLGERFAQLSVIRVFEDVFPDVDVETVLLIANGFGQATNFINYETYKNKISLFRGQAQKTASVAIESTLNGDRPFVSNLLDKQHLSILNKLRSTGVIAPISQFCKFKIGYVCADNSYFHPAPVISHRFHIPDTDFLPAISNAKAIQKGLGLSIKKGQIKARLFYPGNGDPTTSTQNYIRYGEQIGVNQRYKCRQRTPWYITPGIEVPDVILTVFGDKPRLYVNSGGYIASNSLLCGFIKRPKVTSGQLAANWYNSLTLLSIELKVHSLGGGVLVFIPGETDAIEVVSPEVLRIIDGKYQDEIDSLLRAGKLQDAYLLGDNYILRKIGLTLGEISNIREAVQILRQWRNSKLRKSLERIE